MTVLHSQSKSRISQYLSVNDKLSVMTSFMKCPPGLVVHGQVVTVAFSQKLEDIMRSCELRCLNSISNQLCMRNLEMIDGNKKKLWPKNRFLPLRVNFLHFQKFTLSQKYTGRYNWKLTQLLGYEVYLY